MSVNRYTELGKELVRIWEDQRAFNMLFREPPDSPQTLAEQAKEFVIFTESEMHELLRTLPWKKHRRMPFRGNPAHMFEEGADVLKCVLSLLQIIGIDTPEKMVELYWQKTAVVRQRYREEWVEKLDRDCVVVDIDNVLCDYINGMCDWIPRARMFLDSEEHGISNEFQQRIDKVRHDGKYLSAKTLGIRDELWQALKHEFRTTGQKRCLPVFDDALEFLTRCKHAGLRVVLLTSRPIDRYPNIFTDTILWLNNNKLPFDFVWWSSEKAERILEEDGLREKIRFAIDDDEKFVRQFAKARIPTYWLRRHEEFSNTTLDDVFIQQIRSLKEATVLAALRRQDGV